MHSRTLYLCPSDRAARAFHASLATSEIAPPDCVDIERFCRELWLRGQLFGLIGDARDLLDPGASNALWRQVVADETAFSVSEVARVATLASEAWTLAHRYQLPMKTLPGLTAGSDNLALFARCAIRIKTVLEDCGGITQPELPAALIPLLAALRPLLPSRVVLTPSFATNVSQAQLFSAMRSSGVVVDAWNAAHVKNSEQTTAFRFDDETQEMHAAIAWAATLAGDPVHEIEPRYGSVAIVVPDLAARRDVWLTALRERLNPEDWWLDPETDRDQFNLSVGLRLDHYPHIASLLCVLRAALGEADTEQIAQALTHPRWGRSSAAIARIEQHEWALLERGMDRSTLADWLAVLPPDVAACSVLRTRREHGTARNARSLHAASLALAVVALTEQSMIAQSDLFQLDEAWNAALGKWTSHDRWLPPISWRQAVGELDQLASEQTFQPRAGTARIQVMGLLESAGMPLAAAWIVGFIDSVLPETFKPNPMLPMAWQAEQHVGLGSRDGVRQRAAALWRNWLALSGELRVSYAAEIDTGAQRLSPLAAAVPIAPHLETTDPAAAPNNRALLTIADESLPTASTSRPLSAGDIERQAHCPRQAAASFLRLREWPEHVVGISPRVRGTLAHQVMAAVGAARMRGTLEGAGEPGLAELQGVASEAFAQAATLEAGKRPRIPASVWALERSRLLPLVDQVLRLDAARDGFRVLAVEEEVQTSLFNSAFKLRVDRVDDFAAALEDDARFGVVFDYKTGAATRSDWFAENSSGRLAAPQLPLYLFALHAILPPDAPRMGALGYIVISDDDVKFVGVGADPAFAGKRPAKTEPEWYDLTVQWKAQLSDLVNEVQTGVADVAPLKGRATCRYCAVASFCREPWSLAGSGVTEADEDSGAEQGSPS